MRSLIDPPHPSTLEEWTWFDMLGGGPIRVWGFGYSARFDQGDGGDEDDSERQVARAQRQAAKELSFPFRFGIAMGMR